MGPTCRGHDGIALVLVAGVLAMLGQAALAGPGPALSGEADGALGILDEFRSRMLALKRTDEAQDALALRERLTGGHPPQKRGAQDVPRDYDAILSAWAGLGEALGQALEGVPGEETQRLVQWLRLFPAYAEGGRHLNRRRTAIGLCPVTLDFSGSYGFFRHACYAAQNRGHGGDGRESPDRPGYSVEGYAASAAPTRSSRNTLGAAIDEWLGMDSAILFSPKTGRVVLGGDRGWWGCVASGGRPQPATKRVLAFPADGDEGIPVSFEREVSHEGMYVEKAPYAGTPVVIHFQGGAPGKAPCRLLDGSGEEVPVVLISGGNPIRFAARDPLKPGARYRIEVGPQGSLYAGSFRTQGRDRR